MASKAAERSRLGREIDLWLLLAELLNDPARRASAGLSLGTTLVRFRPRTSDPS